ncbi:MAG: response regulator [Deltaproteobacteria bacterium]|nr:response regulator [Deltaproteobacteria bacterium]
MAAPEKMEVTILLVDDDPGHLRLIEKNLRRASLTNPIVKMEDGQAALDYVNSQDGRQNLLMLLDLNMPVLNGYQVLEKLRADNRTKRIPVIILTTTNDPREVDRCYDLGCNVYVTKPVDYGQFSVAIQKLGLLLSVVSIPDRS